MHSSRRASVLIAASVLAAACSREPSAPESAAATSPAPPIETAVEPPPAEPPAESGLAIKRGLAMLAQDRTTFRPCGEQVELWVVDQTDGVVRQTFADASQTSPPLVYVEVYGERSASTEEVPAAREYGGVLILEEVLFAAQENAAGRCAQPAGDYVVAARGNEPFWSIEVGETQMVWRQADEPKEIALEAQQEHDEEGAVRYFASGAGHQLELSIDAQPCRDSMSGDFFAYSARATLDGKSFTGCARVGR